MISIPKKKTNEEYMLVDEALFGLFGLWVWCAVQGEDTWPEGWAHSGGFTHSIWGVQFMLRYGVFYWFKYLGYFFGNSILCILLVLVSGVIRVESLSLVHPCLFVS